MQRIGRAYPHPQGGYGGRFVQWLRSQNPQPYNSCGNGSAMRVSPCGLYAGTLEEALTLARESAEVTHDHPEGIKGAQAVAAAVFLAKQQTPREKIRRYLQENFYPLLRTLDEIRPNYGFEEICQTSVPEAIEAFLESTGFEDAIRNATSLGGDSDTIGTITGSIAWSYYYLSEKEQMDAIATQAESYLPEDLKTILEEFQNR